MTEFQEEDLDCGLSQSEHEDEDDEPCGWGSFHPKTLQQFRKPGCVLFFFCCAIAVQGMVVNGIFKVITTTIERRFDLSSTEVGYIASSYEIGSLLVLFPVTYFGEKGVKPRYIGFGVFISAVGSFICFLPKLIAGNYNAINSGGDSLCDLTSNGSSTYSCETHTESLSNYRFVFYVGQALHGVGATSMLTLAVTYIDDNVSVRSSSLYLGIYNAMSILGPSLGFVIGGTFLNIYVDFDSVDANSLTLTPSNPRWVGAWWMGFVLSSALFFILFIPICGFPSALPGSSKYREEKEKEVYRKQIPATSSPEKDNKLLQAWSSVKVLLTNPTFMFLNLALIADRFVLIGLTSFSPKLVEAQFSLDASTAAAYIGYVTIPAGAIGSVLGGYLIKKFNLDLKSVIRFCLGVTAPCVIFALGLLASCDNVPFAGVNIDYGDAINGSTTIRFLGDFVHSHNCVANCQCSDDYNPVCGTNNVMYYSSCFAGCQNLSSVGLTQIYGGCSCILANPAGSQAKMGKCDSSCAYLPLILSTLAILLLLTSLARVPFLTATLRCVPQESKSVALGIQLIMLRCLGHIPGSIVFGAVIDLTCQLWQNTCGEQGSCLFYDNESMGKNLMAASLGGKCICSLFLLITLYVHKSGHDKSNVISMEKTEKVDHSNKGE